MIHNLLKKWEGYTRVLLMSKEEMDEHVDNELDQSKIHEDPYAEKRNEGAEDNEFLSAEEKFTSEEDNMDIDQMTAKVRAEVIQAHKDHKQNIREGRMREKEILAGPMNDNSSNEASSEMKSGDDIDIGDKFEN